MKWVWRWWTGSIKAFEYRQKADDPDRTTDIIENFEEIKLIMNELRLYTIEHFPGKSSL